MGEDSEKYRGLISAELRWFWRDGCPAAVKDWYYKERLPPGGGNKDEPRVDRYFHQKGNVHLGIKVRDAREGKPPDFEVKGLVTLKELDPGFAAVRAEVWCKWKAPVLRSADEFITEKTRWLRKFDAAADAPTEIPLGLDEKPFPRRDLPDVGCNVELTTVRVHGRPETWSTLCFEAFGDLRSAPEALVRVMRAMAPLPQFDGKLLSYPAWLDAL